MKDDAKELQGGPPAINVCKPRAVASSPHGEESLAWHMSDVGVTGAAGAGMVAKVC